MPERDARFASASRANDFPGRPLGTDPDLVRVSGMREIVPSSGLATTTTASPSSWRTMSSSPGVGLKT